MVQKINNSEPSFRSEALSFLNTRKTAVVALGVIGALVAAGAAALVLTGNFSHLLYGRWTFGECLIYPAVALTVVGGVLYFVIRKASSTKSLEKTVSPREPSPPLEVEQPREPSQFLWRPSPPSWEPSPSPSFRVSSLPSSPYLSIEDVNRIEREFYNTLHGHTVFPKYLEINELERLKAIFGEMKEVKGLEASVLDRFIPEKDEDRVYEDRNFYLKHGELLLWRILARNPELSMKETLPTLRFGAFVLVLKVAEDTAIWNKDFGRMISWAKLNQIELELLKLLDCKTDVTLLTPEENARVRKLEAMVDQRANELREEIENLRKEIPHWDLTEGIDVEEMIAEAYCEELLETKKEIAPEIGKIYHAAMDREIKALKARQQLQRASSEETYQKAE